MDIPVYLLPYYWIFGCFRIFTVVNISANKKSLIWHLYTSVWLSSWDKPREAEMLDGINTDFRSFADTSPNCALKRPGLLRHLFGLLALKQHRCVQSTGPQAWKKEREIQLGWEKGSSGKWQQQPSKIWKPESLLVEAKRHQFSSVQSLSRVRLFVTPWIAAHQASLSTNSQSSLRLMSIESVMPSSHLMLGRPLLLLPPIPPSIRVFSNESTLLMRWPKYWSFSFSIIPSKEIPGLISFRIDWLDLLAVQGTLKSLLQHHSSKASILWRSAFFIKNARNLFLSEKILKELREADRTIRLQCKADSRVKESGRRVWGFTHHIFPFLTTHVDTKLKLPGLNHRRWWLQPWN